MISGLLLVSRVNTKAQPYTTVDCNILLKDVIQAMQSDIDETGATIVVDGELPTIQADEAQLYQLFYQVIDNALKFHNTDHATTISVTAAPAAPGGWQFTITDNGIGVEEGYEDTPEFLAEHKVIVVASLPCYTSDRS